MRRVASAPGPRSGWRRLTPSIVRADQRSGRARARPGRTARLRGSAGAGESTPPVSHCARSHGPIGSWPKRWRHARAVSISASTVSAIAERCDTTGPDWTSSTTYHLAARGRVRRSGGRRVASRGPCRAGVRVARRSGDGPRRARRGGARRRAVWQSVCRPAAAAASAAQGEPSARHRAGARSAPNKAPARQPPTTAEAGQPPGRELGLDAPRVAVHHEHESSTRTPRATPCHATHVAGRGNACWDSYHEPTTTRPDAQPNSSPSYGARLRRESAARSEAHFSGAAGRPTAADRQPRCRGAHRLVPAPIGT